MNIAILLVNNKRAFTWLGHMPVISWSVKHLLEVRGIDKIICCTRDKFIKQAEQALSDDIEVIGGLEKEEQNIEKWLLSTDYLIEDTDVIVTIKPTLPFLTAPKIEACLDNVVRKLATRSCTVREVQVFIPPNVTTMAYMIVPGCNVFTFEGITDKKFKPVTVSLIESLDVSDLDNLQIVNALVQNGF